MPWQCRSQRCTAPRCTTRRLGQCRSSVELLASLEPDRVITGHGPAVQGAQMRDALHRLESNFDRVAVPKGGKYVETRRRTKRAVSTGSPDFHEPESLAP